MRYRKINFQVRDRRDGRYLVKITGERRRFWQRRWRPFVEFATYRARWYRRQEVCSFGSRSLAERAAALMAERTRDSAVSETASSLR